MIKTLQKKFVFTAMLAVTVLLLLLLGAINVTNIIITEKEIDQTLAMISRIDGNAENLEMTPEQPRRPVPGDGLSNDGQPDDIRERKPKNEFDTVISSNFFVIRFDGAENVMLVDVSRTSSVTEEAAEELAREVLAKDEESGKTGKYHYMIRSFADRDELSVVFLDTSEENFSYLRVLLLSALLGALCWLLMLVLVIVLSKRAIRPIAENIEKQKQFVTNAGHEIKTPLAIIQSNTDALELYTGETKWSRNIKEQTARLNGLMKNLLMLSRMDEGAVQTTAADFSLSGLLGDSLQSFAQPFEMRKIAVEAQIAPDVTLHADKAQIEQMIYILLDNALKYTNTGGQLYIGLQKNDKRTVLQMGNTCEELPDAPPDKLFDRFYRADKARTQKNGGYGIGLSVAQSIAAANKGSIEASYIRPDRICFTVTFS